MFLAARSDVGRVAYPGLAEAGASLVGTQMRLGGGMVSFVPAPAAATGGQPRSVPWRSPKGPACSRWPSRSAGSNCSIEVPAAMTHMSVAGSALEVDPALIRLSVGIEALEDLVADLRRALDEG